MTALMHAAYRGNMAVCHKLLQHKADVNWNGHKDGVNMVFSVTNITLSLSPPPPPLPSLLPPSLPLSLCLFAQYTALMFATIAGECHSGSYVSNWRVGASLPIS